MYIYIAKEYTFAIRKKFFQTLIRIYDNGLHEEAHCQHVKVGALVRPNSASSAGLPTSTWTYWRDPKELPLR